MENNFANTKFDASIKWPRKYCFNRRRKRSEYRRIRSFKKESALSSVPIGGFNIHFEKATKDIDLAGLVADINPQKGKLILYMEKWLEEIQNEKILILPKL